MTKTLKFTSFFLLLVALLGLTSCVPSADKAKEKMDKAGYITADLKSVSNYIGIDTSDADIETVMFFVKSENAISILPDLLKGTDYVVAVYYKEASAAKEAYNKIKEENEETVVKKSGKCIYYGTEQGVKDFN